MRFLYLHRLVSILMWLHLALVRLVSREVVWDLLSLCTWILYTLKTLSVGFLIFDGFVSCNLATGILVHSIYAVFS